MDHFTGSYQQREWWNQLVCMHVAGASPIKSKCGSSFLGITSTKAIDESKPGLSINLARLAPAV